MLIAIGLLVWCDLTFAATMPAKNTASVISTDFHLNQIRLIGFYLTAPNDIRWYDMGHDQDVQAQ